MSKIIYDAVYAVSQFNRMVNHVYNAEMVKPVTFFGSASGYSREKNMFNEFESFAAFQNALRAPLAMPIICLQLSASFLMDAFKKLALTALHVATLSPINAYDSFKAGLLGLLTSAFVALRGIFDVIRSTIVLVNRSISTVAVVACLGVNYFKSPKIPAQPEDIDVPSRNLDGAACRV